MREATVNRYAQMADTGVEHTRDLWAAQDRQLRARAHTGYVQSDGRHPLSPGWSRYRPDEQRVTVRDGFGKLVSLSPTQHRVLMAARALEGERITATVLANSIGVATSTVTRALVLLAAFGLVAYDVTRGRYGGITLLRTAWADLKARSRTAWGVIQEQRARAWDRYIAKLERTAYFWSGLNVATIESSAQH